MGNQHGSGEKYVINNNKTITQSHPIRAASWTRSAGFQITGSGGGAVEEWWGGGGRGRGREARHEQ